MNAVLQQVTESVRALSPYQPGRPIAEVAHERGISNIIKLASNENPLGVGEKARQAVQNLADEAFSRYPDANGGLLRNAIAKKLSVPAECILLGNGSNDILELAAHLLLREGTKAVYAEHAFIVYTLAVATRLATAIAVPARDYGHDLDAMAAAANETGVRMVFIANPNNPTGTWHPVAAIRRFLAAVPPQVLVVLDEAYCEYLPDDSDAALALLADFSNLLITRTFSKIHGLAGLRAGYGIADVAIVEMLNRIRQPFNMNAIAQVAALAALNDSDHIAASRNNNAEGMRFITEACRRRDMPFIPSYGNFVAFRPTDAAGLYELLLNQGVIVRKLTEYGMQDWLRASIGTPAENERLINAWW